jgi:hypothetical protein
MKNQSEVSCGTKEKKLELIIGHEPVLIHILFV